MREKEEEKEEEKRRKKEEGKRKGKSCKGTLYYSSLFNSNGLNPLCLGFTRSLHPVPDNIVSESEAEASKDGRSLTDFKYACLGYSVFLNNNDVSPTGDQKPCTELPVCVGIEVLVDKRSVAHQAHAPTPAHGRNKDDERGLPQPRTQQPTNVVEEDFRARFTRSAGLVASGVSRNMSKVGNYIKESVDDILYPYRRPPK